MKGIKLFSIALSILFSTACSSSYEEDYYEDAYYGKEAAYPVRTDESAATGQIQARFASNGEVEMRPLVDSKTGQVTAYAPLPTDWTLGETWKGPGGVKVEMRQGGSAMAQQRPIQSIDQLLEQTFLPELRKANVQINKIVDLPGIAHNNEKNASRYWQAMPMRMTHQVKGIEMTDPNNGKRGMFIVHLSITRSQYSNMNNYYLNVLEADPRHFEKAKNTLIYALENMQLDDRAVAAFNQHEQQKSSRAWAAHNQKMRRRQADFNSWQRSQRDLSEVNDIYFEGWKKRNALNNAGQDKAVNGIWEREAAVDPYSGQQIDVESGYKYYYMNQFGEYFGTNDEFYHPDRDAQINHQEWRRVQSPNGGY